MNATLVPTTVDSPLRMVWTVPTDAADGTRLTCHWTTDTDHTATESPLALAA